MICQEKSNIMLTCLKQQLKKTEIALMLCAWPQASNSLSYLKKKKIEMF